MTGIKSAISEITGGLVGVTTMLLMTVSVNGMAQDYPIHPILFTAVAFADEFWAPRLETNRTVTIPYSFDMCEKTGRIDNFAVAGRLRKGKHQGIFFDDSDVFKIVEGAAYSLAVHPDRKLEEYLNEVIFKIMAAQEDDGYLYTARTIDPDRPALGIGPRRWANTRSAHELYNAGHLYEAAVAHYQATGMRTLLDVAIRNADLVDRVFGPKKNHAVPGHEEIEIGLAKLYRVTDEPRYLALAKFFLDQRGRADQHELYGLYCQDHKPLIEQDEAVGHAVRAGYVYSAMADVAALTGDISYVRAIDRLWGNVVSKKLYLTGGIGARHKGESFGDDYELPNATAYNETCAAIANAMWNHRLFLLHGHTRYIDVLERVVYNGFLSGISLEGNRFFYENPLEGNASRQKWFGCACCPSNIVRFIPSLPGYVYAQRKDNVYVNLFVQGRARLVINEYPVYIEQVTHYPWNGAIAITVFPEKKMKFAINVRIPGWARNEPVPSPLYRYIGEVEGEITLKVNKKKIPLEIENGYVRIERTWKKEDTIHLELPMPVRRVLCDEHVESNRGRVAVERGPIVYCAEWVDNDGQVLNLVLPDEAKLEATYQKDLLRGVVTIKGDAVGVYQTSDEKGIEEKPQPLTLIPYYAWAHRGEGDMAVWLTRDPAMAKPPENE